MNEKATGWQISKGKVTRDIANAKQKKLCIKSRWLHYQGNIKAPGDQAKLINKFVCYILIVEWCEIIRDEPHQFLCQTWRKVVQVSRICWS